jgi:hypothetical protein
LGLGEGSGGLAEGLSEDWVGEEGSEGGGHFGGGIGQEDFLLILRANTFGS